VTWCGASGENRCNEFGHRPLHVSVVCNGPTDGHITGAPGFNPTGNQLAGVHQQAGTDPLLEAMVTQMPHLGAEGGQVKNIDRLPALLDELVEVVAGIREVGASRAAKGKSLSSLTFEVLGWAEEDLPRITTEVKGILASPREVAARAYVRLLQQRHRAAG